MLLTRKYIEKQPGIYAGCLIHVLSILDNIIYGFCRSPANLLAGKCESAHSRFLLFSPLMKLESSL